MSQTMFPLPPDHGRWSGFFRRHTNTIMSHPVCAWFFAGCVACILGAWFSGGEMFIMIPALILGWFFASVAWWWAPSLSKPAKVTWIFLSAAPLFAEGVILHWHFLPAAKEVLRIQPPVQQPASILFEWKWSRLPTVMPASGTVWTMPITSELEFGAHAVFLSPRAGTAGDKLTWSEDTRQYGGVYRCDVTNYADNSIFNLAMNFKTDFYKPESDGSRKAETPIAESYDRPLTINKLDPKETFSFYAYSDSRLYVSVWLPKVVTYLRGDQDHRQAAHLLPQAEQSITLFPMTLINQPKAPPVPPPPAPSPPNKQGKK
jgi:hypothetical protein